MLSKIFDNNNDKPWKVSKAMRAKPKTLEICENFACFMFSCFSQFFHFLIFSCFLFFHFVCCHVFVFFGRKNSEKEKTLGNCYCKNVDSPSRKFDFWALVDMGHLRVTPLFIFLHFSFFMFSILSFF